MLLVADMKELKANPSRRAKGIVIEAKLEQGARACGNGIGTERDAAKR